jgi:hypothetical protein
LAPHRHVPRERLNELTGAVTGEAAEALLANGCAQGMRDDTIRRDLPRAVAAAAELQQRGCEPTDGALHAAGAPEPRKIQRLLECADLSDLAAVQSRTAIDAGMVPAPTALVVEAHTDPTRGPGKAGAIHLQPPPGVEVPGAGKGAKNTEGGIAAAVALGESDGILLPFGAIPLYQGFWHPDNHGPARAEEAEAALREAGGVTGPFTRTPPDVAQALVQHLGSVDRLKEWSVGLEPRFICGGRLRMGYPPKDGDVGAGTEERFLGGDLGAVRTIAEAGLVPFFELPHNFRGPVAAAPGDWRFRMGGETLVLDELVTMVFDADSPWVSAAREILAEVAAPGTIARWVRATVLAPGSFSIELTVLALARAGGQLDLFVTTLEVGGTDDLLALVRQGAEELRRRERGSVVNVGVRALLTDGYLQRHQRRRAHERASFGAVAQAAFGVLELARRAA